MAGDAISWPGNTEGRTGWGRGLRVEDKGKEIKSSLGALSESSCEMSESRCQLGYRI